MDIIEWIDAYKASHGIKSDNEFSRLVGISAGLLSRWRSGKCTPSTSKLEQIAESTGTELNLLISGDPVLGEFIYGKDISGSRSINGAINESVRFIRVYSADEIIAGTDFNIPEEPDTVGWQPGWLEKAVLPNRFTNPEEYFAMALTDNNMAPELHSGDIVIVHIQEDAADGDIVVVCIGNSSAACAILNHFDEGIVLNSPTRKPAPSFFSNHSVHNLPVLIMGKVVDILHREYR